MVLYLRGTRFESQSIHTGVGRRAYTIFVRKPEVKEISWKIYA
jgi:hypothetical protein